ncbi:hypothetical protein [Flammeovirga sp. EKP202]|uniref:hypothetical protein n=1 Tax=Flammeovirga sp. EKP202 TaxID=2770592 RepID=UPI00165F01B4|nr:hypothetical protein [Flammeovirga sp. EKP202]MBD0400635.1 hypothetical protein [Flammeovirga sp. EKP202]
MKNLANLFSLLFIVTMTFSCSSKDEENPNIDQVFVRTSEATDGKTSEVLIQKTVSGIGTIEKRWKEVTVNDEGDTLSIGHYHLLGDFDSVSIFQAGVTDYHVTTHTLRESIVTLPDLTPEEKETKGDGRVETLNWLWEDINSFSLPDLY